MGNQKTLANNAGFKRGVMNYQILKDELDNDPELRGYSGMSNREAADDLSLEIRPTNRDWMEGSEAYDQTNSEEFSNLSDVAKSQWLSLCAIQRVNPFGPAAQMAIDLFPVAGETITNLQNSRIKFISRGSEIGYGKVQEGDVEQARLL